MKKYVLLNLCFIALAFALHAASGVNQQIDRVGSFTFPFPPHISDVAGMRNYLCTTDSCSYLVQVKPLNKAGVIHDTATLHAFYSGSVKGIMRGAHGSLIGEKPVYLHGAEAEEIEYVKGDKDHQPISVCSRILLIKGNVVVYSFSAPYERFIALRHLRDQFFESFQIDSLPSTQKVIADSAHTVSADTADFATPLFDSVSQVKHPVVVHTELMRPNTVHFIVSFALCILLLASILYILVRWKKRNTK